MTSQALPLSQSLCLTTAAKKWPSSHSANLQDRGVDPCPSQHSCSLFIANRDALKNMLVTLYHGILRPKQDPILKSSSGTSQNILKHHIYTVLPKPSSKKLKKLSALSSPPPSRMMAFTPLDQNPALASTQSSILLV